MIFGKKYCLGNGVNTFLKQYLLGTPNNLVILLCLSLPPLTKRKASDVSTTQTDTLDTIQQVFIILEDSLLLFLFNQ